MAVKRIYRAFKPLIYWGRSSERRATHSPVRRRRGAVAILALLMVVVATESLAVGSVPRAPVAFGRPTAPLFLGIHQGTHQLKVPKPGLSADQPDLQNVQMNADYSPKAPQGEPAVAASLDSPLTAVAAAIDAGGDGFWIGGTTDGGRTWSNFFQSW